MVAALLRLCGGSKVNPVLPTPAPPPVSFRGAAMVGRGRRYGGCPGPHGDIPARLIRKTSRFFLPFFGLVGSGPENTTPCDPITFLHAPRLPLSEASP